MPARTSGVSGKENGVGARACAGQWDGRTGVVDQQALRPFTRDTVNLGLQLLLEAAVLGLAGGLTGVSTALVIVISVAKARSWTAVLDPSLVVAAPGIGLLIGVVAGLYPAWKASRVEPAEALRGI